MMETRRGFIATVVATFASVSAGCTGGTDDTSDDGSSGNEDEQDNESESGGDGSDDGGGDTGLVIKEDELVVSDDTLEQVTVEGIVENTGDEAVDYAEVEVTVYDADGNQLDQYFTNTENLDAGDTWAFEVMIPEDAEDVEEYEIAVDDSALD